MHKRGCSFEYKIAKYSTKVSCYMITDQTTKISIYEVLQRAIQFGTVRSIPINLPYPLMLQHISS